MIKIFSKLLPWIVALAVLALTGILFAAFKSPTKKQPML